MVLSVLVSIAQLLRGRLESEEGYSTAELLANAALAIGALVIIWGAMGGLGTNVIDWISIQLTGSA